MKLNCREAKKCGAARMQLRESCPTCYSFLFFSFLADVVPLAIQIMKASR